MPKPEDTDNLTLDDVDGEEAQRFFERLVDEHGTKALEVLHLVGLQEKVYYDGEIIHEFLPMDQEEQRIFFDKGAQISEPQIENLGQKMIKQVDTPEIQEIAENARPIDVPTRSSATRQVEMKKDLSHPEVQKEMKEYMENVK